METGLIDSPEEFFGRRTRIIRVAPASENQGLQVIENNGFGLDLEFPAGDLPDNIRSINIGSGTPLRYGGIPDWIFVPFNYKMPERIRPFTDALTRSGLDIEDLNSIDKIPTHKKLIIEAYQEVEGDLNKTSLVLYSGPKHRQGTEESDRCYFNRHEFWPNEALIHLSGCLYTGDADVNEPDLIEDLSLKMYGLHQNIGTLLAPHHGAIGNFHRSLLNLIPTLQSVIFPYGDTNSYGHPADAVIAAVVGHALPGNDPDLPWRRPRNMIVRITEDLESIAVYHFLNL